MIPTKPKGQAWRERMRAEAKVFADLGKHIAAEHLHRAIIADARLEAALSPGLDRQIRGGESR